MGFTAAESNTSEDNAPFANIVPQGGSGLQEKGQNGLGKDEPKDGEDGTLADSHADPDRVEGPVVPPVSPEDFIEGKSVGDPLL